MRCEFREQPPTLVQPVMVDAVELLEAIRSSFYTDLDEPIALFPSLEDAVVYLAFMLGGLRATPTLPKMLRAYASRTGVPFYSNPAADGTILTCEDVCVDEVVVVYEGYRVAQPAPTLAACTDCIVYSIADLRAYGVGSSIAWVAGLQRQLLLASRIPGYRELSALVSRVRRLRAKNLARVRSVGVRVERVGPFACFTRGWTPPYAEAVDASVYGLPGFKAISLFMSPVCYLGGVPREHS